MNRRGFLWAVSAAGLAWWTRGPAAEVTSSPEIVEMNSVVRQALRERRILHFRYHGFARGVEPHALGLLSDDRLALLAWQSAGESHSEPPPGWRTFVLSEIEQVELASNTFTPRADFDAEKTNLKTILASVKRE